MAISNRQKFFISFHILRQMLFRKSKYSLVLMLEPLYTCNLKCRGCGKIHLADKAPGTRLSVAECVGAAEEANVPVVSIGGGEPLLHPEIPEVVSRLIARKRFVYLCTNALLLQKRIPEFSPSPFLSFSIHFDGLEAHHDEVVGRKGVFANAVDAIQLLRRLGFRVTTNTTLFRDDTPENAAALFDFLTSLGVDGMTVAPAFHYETAMDQTHFIRDREAIRSFFRRLFEIGRRRNWPFNHSSVYLDFLAGRYDFPCTPWGNPTRNIFGWQKPCYLLNEGYVHSYDELIRKTDWDAYGVGKNPKCGSCMVHCGFEPTAVTESIRHPLRLLG
ncbi:adenosyl-hopene transferase HpnH [Desulfatirhabdium butyrativorans]|uniref:adenosyl-hopene transferase HpnH n=1 Tax=Desulfatirhabdium butyrativorans TaxID=340467 RepID=UPI000406CF38|nr:adenosyl-hopene transferase HpnH [Desulfatirhabdium butyrativorans]